MNPPQNPEHKPVCEKHKDCHLMISSAKECFWPPCVRIGCHKHRQYIDEVAPALTEKQWDKLESRSQRVDWRERFDKEFKYAWSDDTDFREGGDSLTEMLKAFITKELADARREERRMVIGGLVTLVESLIGAKADEFNTKDTLLLCVVLVNIKEDLKRTLLNNLKEDV